MAAYRSGDLKAQGEEDIVTYWANGKLIKGPTKYQSDEFYELWKEHGPTGFWQEWVGSVLYGYRKTYNANSNSLAWRVRPEVLPPANPCYRYCAS
jgi:hypothetical protein